MFPRKNATERFYDIEDYPGPEEPAIVAGVRWLFRYAAERGDGRGVLVLQTLQSIDYLARTIGPGPAKELRQNRQLRPNGGTIDFCTMRDLGAVRRDAPVLFVWADGDGLTKLDDRQPMALCAVASSEELFGSWLRIWSPQPLREETTPVQSSPNVSPALAVALADLTAFVNLGSGLVAPEHRAAAIDLFRKLIAAGEPVVPGAARAWAAKNGWTASGAQQLEAVASDVLAGRQLRAREFLWPADVAERWRAGGGQQP